jgi:cytochrome d ubiquinol oxidase subunit II
MITHLFLQQYWWLIISLLAAILVFLMFVQGGQSFLFSLPGNDTERSLVVNTLGRKWEFTFTTLVTFGGAFFAAFPLFYATSFGGAYWVWTAILFSFILQAVAYEYRSKPGNIFGSRTYDLFLFINGSAGPFLIGVAVATFYTGSNFTLNNMNQVQWANSWHGLEALTDGRNLALGLAVLFLARCNGLLYIINSVDSERIHSVSVRKLLVNSVAFLAFFLLFLASLLLMKGYAYDNNTGEVFMQDYKYFQNLLGMPVVLLMFLAGVVAVLYGLFLSIFKAGKKGIWLTGSGTIAVVFALFITAGFNNTVFYPSAIDLQSSLTIRNASSSLFTLKTMMYVSFLIPFVAAYIWFAWKAINNKPVTETELNEEHHKY